MKKILAIILAATMIVALAACGGSSTGGSTSGGSSAGGSTEGSAAAAGETVDVGKFTVTVPTGWMGVEQTDMFEETDAEGNYPVLDDAYSMIKGGESEWDALTKPTVYVYYYDDYSAEEQCEDNKFWYDETEDISVTINGKECFAFECESLGYIYQYVFYPVTDTTCFQFNIPKDMDGTEGVTVDDADVKTIMESVKVK